MQSHQCYQLPLHTKRGRNHEEHYLGIHIHQKNMIKTILGSEATAKATLSRLPIFCMWVGFSMNNPLLLHMDSLFRPCSCRHNNSGSTCMRLRVGRDRAVKIFLSKKRNIFASFRIRHLSHLNRPMLFCTRPSFSKQWAY